MSGIFGIYDQDHIQISTDQLKHMANSIMHRGPDGTNIIHKQHVGLGHSMLHTTPEALNERLPFTDSKSGLTITSDARIDNRDDLANKLGLHRINEIPDSQLILHAYKKWGSASFSKLVGDFSIVIWNPKLQQLTCVRDYIGVKALYYHRNDTQFIFSSELKQLADYVKDLEEGL